MAQALAHLVPDPGTAIIVAFLAAAIGLAFWLSTVPVREIVDPVEAEFASVPVADPEDAARKAVL